MIIILITKEKGLQKKINVLKKKKTFKNNEK